MFKKQVTVTAGPTLLSNKDVKQVRKTLSTLYASTLSEDDIKLLLPSKSEARSWWRTRLSQPTPVKHQVTTSKLSNRTVVYSIGGSPLLFDPDGRGDFILPTVYALWLLPHMLPTIYTHSEVGVCIRQATSHTATQVSPKVLGGADLFLQGVILPPTGPPALAANDVCSIAIPDNPRHPFAVGAMHVSTADAAAAGWKGKGVRLLHVLGDGLWALGDRAMPHPSVTLAQIHPLLDDAAPDVEQAVAQLGLEDAAGDAAARDVSADAPMDAVSMDALLDQTLLRALAAMPDTALPILPSDLYARFMLPNRPAGVRGLTWCRHAVVCV